MRIALLDDAPWFERLGAPWTIEERAAADAYAAACGAALEIVDDVESAGPIAADGSASERDVSEVVSLQLAAEATLGAAALQSGLQHIAHAARERLEASAGAAISDPALAGAAAATAALALQRAALAAAASGDSVGPFDDRFTCAEAVFATGRWPLAQVGTTVYVL